MTKTRTADSRLRAALLRGALAAVFVAAGGCSLVLDTNGLDVPDAMGPSLVGPDASDSDDAGEDGGASVDAPAATDARPADGRADAAGDADAAISAESGSQDVGVDAAADAPDDRAVDAAGSDASATDGAAPDANGGGPEAGSDGCALTTHTNGLGQTWEDCAALNTRNRTEAQSACNALATGGGCVAQSACNFSYVGVSLSDGDGGMTTYLWIYSTQNNNTRTSPGDVIAYPSGTAQCNNLPRRTATWH
jgi:hypothetical protein